MSFNLLIGVPTYIYILVSLWNFQPFNYFLWNSLKNKLRTLVLSFLFFILFPGLSINFILFNDFFFIRLLLRFHFPFYSPPQSLAFCFFHFPPVLIFLFLMPPPLPAIPLSVPLHQTLRQPKHLAIIQCLMAFTCSLIILQTTLSTKYPNDPTRHDDLTLVGAFQQLTSSSPVVGTSHQHTNKQTWRMTRFFFPSQISALKVYSV